MTKSDNIIITDTDAKRLEKLLATLNEANYPGKQELEYEIDRANIVSSRAVPSNVVTMNSVVRFRLESNRKEFTLKLVYPDDKSETEGVVSVLAPVGSALLGLSEGAYIYWSKPGGGRMRIKIVSIEYQPEREGAYHI